MDVGESSSSAAEAEAPPFWVDFARLQMGLFLFGLAISLMLEARIGLDPWSSFHEALSLRSGLSFGRITQIVGLALIVFSYTVLRVKPGIATICNMLLIGPWVDWLRPMPWLPTADGLLVGTIQFLAGIGVLGLASAVYLGARLGAGPRDGLVLGLSQRIRKSLRSTRVTIEVVVLGLGWIMGGPIGLGTVIFAVMMGPTMQTSMRMLRVPHDPSPRKASRATASTPPESTESL